MTDRTVSECQECERIRAEYNQASGRLLTAQRELAMYDVERNGEFVVKWKTCESALKEIWDLREHMANHARAHERTE